MKKTDIAFCVNNAYIEKVAVVMVSLLENHPESQIHFYIFSSDLTDKSLKYLNKLHTKYNNFEVSKVDVPVDLFKSLKLNIEYISIETYYRYAIAELLPDLDKILYIDADLVIKAAAVLAAVLAIGGFIYKIITWVQRQKRQDEDIAEMKAELCLLTYGVLACLKGLKEQGCPVTNAIEKIEKHMNQQAHDQKKEGIS